MARTDGQLESDDLIQDREVEDAHGDRLSHGHIADQLHRLVLSVPMPTNIAVWGPWGSGKTGVANLLRCLLEKERGVRFVRFDAFKYAENPLRRNFISAVAGALGIRDSPFHDELYGGQVTTKLEFRRRDVRKLLLTYLQMFGLVAGVSVVTVLLLAGAKEGPFRQTFLDMTTDALQAGIAPAALLTSLAVLVSRTLTREHKTDAADSDEQFEKLFNDLVSRSKVKRLVVFVDELDRCAPSDVVATLDALRTFLGVNRCVFVVAADQQVLEEALTRALAQATPADTVNPYYSSGSGYLDKVFQYQISLPPLLVPQVTSFAAGLVRGRRGVWGKLDIDLIVSILVPSHVRSPRRVKALLNTFALTYRLAEQRAAEGLLEIDPAVRAEEIARLVCLRVEFPLFARDLLLDHRLCDYVLLLSDDPGVELGAYVTEQVQQAAKGYAGLHASVDRHLSAGPTGNGAETAEVRKHHGRQLVAYLQRTRTVSGPGRDLIFLQTSGSVFGLPAALAETLEQHAQNADLTQLRSVVASLVPGERPAVLALLTQQARDAIGLEAWNVAQAVVAVCGDEALPLEGGADAAIETIAPSLVGSPYELPAEVLPGCWRLALASSRGVAMAMRSLVLRHSALDKRAELTAVLLRDVSAALAADAGRVQRLVCAHLLGDGCDQVIAMLAGLPAAAAEQLMDSVAPTLAKDLQTALEAYEAWSEAAQASAAVGAVPGTAETSASEEEPPRSPDDTMEGLETLLERWCSDSPRATHSVVGLMLGLNRKSCRETVEEHLEKIPTVRDTALARTILSSACRQFVVSWPAWLAVLDSSVAFDEVEDQLTPLLQKLWALASDADDPLAPAIVGEAAAAFVRLFGDRPAGQYPDITPIVLDSLDTAATTDDEAAERARLLETLRPLETSGLLDRSALVRHETAAVISTLAADITEEPEVDGNLLTYLDASCADCLDGFGSAVNHPLSADQARGLVEAVDDCGWLPEPDHTRLRISCRMAIADQLPGLGLEALPSASHMASYARKHSTRAWAAIADWILVEKPSGPDMLTVTAWTLRSARPPVDAALLHAIASRLTALSVSEQTDFWHGLIGSPRMSVPQQTLVTAGWPQLSDAHAAALLAQRYADSSNNSDRQAVLDLWQSASLTSEAARRKLLEGVLMPMLGLNQTAADLALSYLPRLAPPVPGGARTALRKAVADSTQKWSVLETRGISALKAAGYSTERHGLLRRERISKNNDD